MMKCRLYISLILVATLLAAVVTNAHGESSYTMTSAIEVGSLSPNQSKALKDFVLINVRGQKRSLYPIDLCTSATEINSKKESVKPAVAVVAAKLIPEFTFQKMIASGQSLSSTIRYAFEFEPDSVLIHSSNPRYPSQTQGLKVAFDSTYAQTIWFEGKSQLSMVFVIPPVKNCRVQPIMACPRTYTGNRTFEDTGLLMNGVRYKFSTKADGLFKAPENLDGKIQACTLATPRVSLPDSWSTYAIAADSPSVSFSAQTPTDNAAVESPLSPNSLPFSDAVESRLEFGTATEVLRIVSARATIEVSGVTLKDPQTIFVDGSDATLKPGGCFMITHRRESNP